MRKMRIFIINQLGFSRTEANGVILLVILILFIFFLRWLLPKNNTLDIDTQTGLKNWEQKIKNSDTLKYSSSSIKDFELVVFNPNSISVEALKNLGFNNAIANRIEKYRQKGDYFRKGED